MIGLEAMDDTNAMNGADAIDAFISKVPTNETGTDKHIAWNTRAATVSSSGSTHGSDLTLRARTSLLSKQSTTLSMLDRARSIQRDTVYVKQVANELGNPPIIANERCGSWYVPLELKADSVYFKSTDGHTGHWNFSTRRLNIGLLHVLGRNRLSVICEIF